MVALECGEHSFEGWPLPAIDGAIEVGGSPWLAGMRANTWRYGPFAWPLPGFGAFTSVAKASSELDVYLMCIPATSILKQGIALKDLAAFFESQSGETMFASEVQMVRMTPDAMVWVPYGSLAIPVAVLDETKPVEQKVPADMDPEKVLLRAGIVHMWCWTPFIAEYAVAVDLGAWRAITQWNKEYFDKHAAQRLWSERAKRVNAFLESMIVS